MIIFKFAVALFVQFSISEGNLILWWLVTCWLWSRHGCMARCGHGLPKVSGHFRGDLPSRCAACSRLLPLWTPNAVRLWFTSSSLFFNGNRFFLRKMGHFDTSEDLKYRNLQFPYVGLPNIQKISISLFHHVWKNKEIPSFRMFRSPTRKIEISVFQVLWCVKMSHFP
jgi:hypothetical protein